MICKEAERTLPWRITHIGGLSTRSPTSLFRTFPSRSIAQVAYLLLLEEVGHSAVAQNLSSSFVNVGDFGGSPSLGLDGGRKSEF